jgi:hypothetical protein
MNKFINVPRAAIVDRLTAAGFTPDVFGGELVYIRRHTHDARLVVKVYTSLPARAGDVRARGEDAIRILGLFIWTAGGKEKVKELYAAKVLRVNSVEGTIERIVEAARDAWKTLNHYWNDTLRPQRKDI